MLKLMLARITSLNVRAGSAVCTLMFIVPVLIAPTLAMAQTTPDSPALNRTPPVWWGYAILFFLLVAVLLVSLMPSKRSHQD
jgi:hypothetical protein